MPAHPAPPPPSVLPVLADAVPVSGCPARPPPRPVQIQYLLLVSRQGKVRLTKWYSPFSQKDKNRIMREVTAMVLSRPPKMCNFIEWKEKKIVYKRWARVVWARPAGPLSLPLVPCGALRSYASLYFVACVDNEDNELITLEVIHHFVEVLDRYFGNVRAGAAGTLPRAVR